MVGTSKDVVQDFEGVVLLCRVSPYGGQCMQAMVTGGALRAGSIFTSEPPWRILIDMKRWYLYLIAVPLGLVLLVYLVGLNFSINLADIWSRDHSTKNTKRDVGKMAEANAAPIEVLRLRHKHRLRPLTDREEGIPIQDLPNGIYGFSMCSVAALRATRGNTFSLEIQKHDGIVFYVGYASDEHIEKYLTRQKNFHILTSPHSRREASSLFEIPVEFVSKCEERPIGDGYIFDLSVSAIPELQT